jgi:nicotinate-nucleotide pyrophosphorylase (carboxylating)
MESTPENRRPLMLPPAPVVAGIVANALAEDIGFGDLTTSAMIGPDARTSGVIIARAEGVIAGLPFAAEVFRQVDTRIVLEQVVNDGDRVHPNDVVARLSGPARGVLTGERVALNLLQQLSGVATLTRRIVDELAGTNARLLDTRKTVPGLRPLQRYAVRAGGGTNHRYNLADGVLIKENHITVAGGITAAIQRARSAIGPMTRVEVEVESLEQLEEALAAGADMVLLDNMTPEQLRQAVELNAGRATLEASGDISVETAAAVAASGVDYLSSGALTHSAKALNLSLLLDPIDALPDSEDHS